MSACVIFGLLVVSSSKAVEDSRLRPGLTKVFEIYERGDIHTLTAKRRISPGDVNKKIAENFSAMFSV